MYFRIKEKVHAMPRIRATAERFHGQTFQVPLLIGLGDGLGNHFPTRLR